MPTLRSLKVTIPEDEVLRLQGYPPGRKPPPALRRAIIRQVSATYKLVQAAAAYDLVRVQHMDNLRVLLDGGYCLSVGKQVQEWQGAEYLALAVCTIGPSLESEASRLMAAEDLSAAAFLDTAGSVAVERLAAMVCARLCQHARHLGMGSGIRLGPGQGDWALDDQTQFFRLLRPERIDISLSRSFLMLPLKSVSFAIAIGKALESKNDSPCLHCGMDRCAYRRRS